MVHLMSFGYRDHIKRFNIYSVLYTLQLHGQYSLHGHLILAKLMFGIVQPHDV